jgi:hypothetical protein
MRIFSGLVCSSALWGASVKLWVPSSVSRRVETRGCEVQWKA